MSDDFKVDAAHLSGQKAQQAAAQKGELRTDIFQDECVENLLSWIETGSFNPILMTRRFEPLEVKAKKSTKEEEADKTTRKELDVAEVELLEEISQQFAKQNPELDPRSLLNLYSQLLPSDSLEGILRKVLNFYPDQSLADDALDFLLASTRGEMAEKIRQAKEQLNQQYSREIRAGKNIAQQARDFSQQGLGAPTALRDLYRDITGNPRDPQSLFAELSNKFDFNKMKSVVTFILHALGSDLKSKGPSIDRGELHRLMTEGRALQAILGVYYFFKSRLGLINSAFKRQSSSLPNRITFEQLAKLFVRFLQERYPSVDKVRQMAEYLDLLEDLLGQTIIYTQMRDAVRYVAPRLFKSEQHRQDVLTTFIEAIIAIDDELDKVEDEE